MLATVAIVAMLAVNLLPVGLQWLQQEQEHAAVSAQLEAAKQRSEELKQSLAAWDNDNYVASQAKSRLGFSWPGETRFSVVGIPEDAQSGTEDEMPKAPSRPWTYSLLDSLLYVDNPPASDGLVGIDPGQGQSGDAGASVGTGETGQDEGA